MRLPLAYVGKVTSKSRLHLIYDEWHGYALCGVGGWLHYVPKGRADLEKRICKNCLRRERKLLGKEDHGQV